MHNLTKGIADQKKKNEKNNDTKDKALERVHKIELSDFGQNFFSRRVVRKIF